MLVEGACPYPHLRLGTSIVVDMIIVVFQPYYDTTVLQSISCDETYLTLSDSKNLHTDIKEEEDPLLITCPLTNTENKVSLF